jgi:predicted flap endonuclease-1-like 5' DNA nuclease
MHMAKLSEIEGIGESYEAKLNDAGVNSMEELLQVCSTKKGRVDLAERTGISEKMILKWANHADLARIKGVGGEYAELLEAAGVDTVPELATRKAENLYGKMVEVNEAKSLVRKLPTEKQVADWIEQAKDLPRVMQY